MKRIILLFIPFILLGQFKSQRCLPDRYTIWELRNNSIINNSFVDFSQYEHTTIGVGSPSYSTNFIYYGNKSIYFPRVNNAYAYISNTPQIFDFGSDEFSFTCIYVNNYTAGFANRLIFYDYNGSIGIFTVNNETYYSYGISKPDGSYLVNRFNQNIIPNNIGQWSIVTIERYNDTVFCYHNRVLKVKDYVGSGAVKYTATNLYLFSYSGYTYPTEGYLAYANISKKARFKGNEFRFYNRY